ncbi:GDP-mannose 4,6-dehydratase [Arthrobacter cavernae]|uniref:GDP-mannose 4,6-dehydratase n=1 Tax=Arthrobacter cavernae TaxID=2817681 RepID=A0A939KLW8_9MICC|nr:GDP-mannose 4,6-dehydratase [Arthrobacter cavernae]MBO1267703.1 GDP-mannose 4,6-dehydratase [Arthrobacter cavernae]
MPENSPRAFVTGITGQDGSYLSEQLLGAGWDVHALVRREQGSEPATPAAPVLLDQRIRQHRGDLADPSQLAALIQDIQPGVVFNLGGISSVARSWEEPALTAQVSGVAVTAMLEAAWRFQENSGKPVKFVQASSAEIFGSATHSPQTEETAIRPVSPYGAAKAYAHSMVDIYRERGLAASSAILYNHESPRRPLDFVTRKITSQVAAIAAGSGERLGLGNLEARRDWGWAPDFVDAMLRMAAAETADDYIIATGTAHSVSDFVAASFAAVGIEDWEEHVFIDQRFVRPADASEMRGDASKARRQLGWEPTVEFKEIVARMTRHDVSLLEKDGLHE